MNITVERRVQIGSGRSTHFPEKRLDESVRVGQPHFSYDLLGHSTGGMCGMQWDVWYAVGAFAKVLTSKGPDQAGYCERTEQRGSLAVFSPGSFSPI